MSLTTITFLPLLGAVVLLLVRRDSRAVRAGALVTSLATFAISLPLPFLLQPGGGYQFTVNLPWLPFIGARYAMGLDGISVFLVLLTTFIMPLAILGSWNYIRVRQREFYIAMLVLETGLIGVFTAADLFLFYIFFEASLIPMYLIIGMWGGPARLDATLKFFLYTMFGSLLMFVAILYLGAQARQAGLETPFMIPELVAAFAPGDLLSRTEQMWLFAAFAVAFAVKVPLFPLHTWLPSAHVEAPTPGSVLLAAVLLKVGAYGYLRLAIPLFPDAAVTAAPVLIALAIVGIIYGALMALAQDDVKKLIAYSSVSHLGFCMLGFFVFNVQGLTGGLFQMVSHGIISAGLFLLAGLLYERRHTRLVDQFGGLAGSVPGLAAVFLLIALGAIGLPLSSGFVGEFTILLGAFQLNWMYGLLAGLGIILGAVYMLYLVHRVFYGGLNREENRTMPDLNPREKAVLVPLVFMVFFMGIFPRLFTDIMEPDVTKILAPVEAAQARRARDEREAQVVQRPDDSTQPTRTVE